MYCQATSRVEDQATGQSPHALLAHEGMLQEFQVLPSGNGFQGPCHACR